MLCSDTLLPFRNGFIPNKKTMQNSNTEKKTTKGIIPKTLGYIAIVDVDFSLNHLKKSRNHHRKTGRTITPNAIFIDLSTHSKTPSVLNFISPLYALFKKIAASAATGKAIMSRRYI